MPQESLLPDKPDDPMDARTEQSVGRIEDLGERLREKRLGLRLTLEQAAQEIGVSAATLSRWERQYSSHPEISMRKAPPQPDVRTLKAITKWLGVSLTNAVDVGPVSSTHDIVHHEGDDLPNIVEAHLRADRKLDERTATALSNLFRSAYKQFAQFSETSDTRGGEEDIEDKT